MLKYGVFGLAALGLAGMALAQTANVESYSLDGVDVQVTVHPFLTEEEVATLRLVGQNREALGLFIADGPGYSALAVAPAEGFIRDGVPIGSAIALSGLESAEAASQAAIEACDAARQGGPDCVVVLEVASR